MRTAGLSNCSSRTTGARCQSERGLRATYSRSQETNGVSLVGFREGDVVNLDAQGQQVDADLADLQGAAGLGSDPRPGAVAQQTGAEQGRGGGGEQNQGDHDQQWAFPATHRRLRQKYFHLKANTKTSPCNLPTGILRLRA